MFYLVQDWEVKVKSFPLDQMEAMLTYVKECIEEGPSDRTVNASGIHLIPHAETVMKALGRKSVANIANHVL